MNNKNPTPGEIVILAAGAVALIASFLPFYDPDFGDSVSSWDDAVFPVGTLIMVFAVAAAVIVALNKFANVNITGFLGFGVVQLLIALGFFSAILAIAFFIYDPFAGVDKGIGFWLMLLSGIASLVGGILVMNERKSVGPGPV
jgi:hypothetical protein